MSNDEGTKGPSKEQKPVIRVQRRRPAGQTSPEGRERAEAPHRDEREEQQGGFTTTPSRTGETGGSGTGTGGGALPSIPIKLSGRNVLIIGALALLCICAFGAFLLLGGGGGGGEQGIVLPTEPAGGTQGLIPETNAPTAEPFIAPTRTAGAGGQTWLVMLYEDADDKVLEQDVYVDLNEAERVGSSDSVKIVAQMDRFSAGYTGDGDWTSTRRYYVTQDNDLAHVNSQLVQDLGEANMSDPKTLVDFVTWAMQTFPSDKQVLILSDHGMGWPGGMSDPAPATRGDSSTPLSSAIGNMMYLNNMDAALQTIRERTGLDKLEMIGLDACLMSQAEVLSALAPHARYAVVSEETEPALGWAYASFLRALEQDPGMSGAELGKLIVDSYVEQDQRIVDDQARAELMRQGSPMGGMFGFGGVPSASQVASQMEHDITLAALDLTAMPELLNSINDLSYALQQASQSQVARARTYAQSFTSIFGQQVPASYIDLGSFAQLLKQTQAGVDGPADGLLAALQQVVIAEKHGQGKPGATGIAIYFPNSQLFQSPVAGPESYTAIARRFAEESTWDDFLTFHYTGRTFEAAAHQATVPESGTTATAPGTGKIELSPIQLSDTVAAPGRPILMSTDISGDNLGYVLFFAEYIDQQSNSMMLVDMDYLDSGDTRDIDGVYYPVWPETAFTMEFEWEPLMFAISDGSDSVTALLMPVTYGATAEEATYAVDGTYTFASGESRSARLYFRNGALQQVFTFSGDGATGAPREVYPQTGDTFTVWEQWIDLNEQGQAVQQATEAGGTLTFRDQMFTYKELDAAVGDYVIGFLAVDLDGNRTQVAERVTVE
jgi:hypothetical protein